MQSSRTKEETQSWSAWLPTVSSVPESTEANILLYGFQHQLNIQLRWDLLKSLAVLTTMLSAPLLPPTQAPQSSVHVEAPRYVAP